jgi:glyoxylase-like metal-dependent hydrolase (beta-lactamase superfamily II)
VPHAFPVLARRAVFAALLVCIASAGCQVAAQAPAAAAAPSHVLPRPPQPVPAVRFSVVKTGETPTRDALTWSGGSWSRKVMANHVAVLVNHPSGRFLIDSGLGSQTGRHFDEEMPWWVKPLMRYQGFSPARAQLDARGEPPVSRIVLTHGHWDHVSALHDFPDAEVWLTASELAYLRAAKPPSVLPSQVSAPGTRWRPYALEARRFGPFEQHLDLFGDGSVVLLPLFGHTPGSVGVLVALSSGRQALFIGDVAWKVDGVTHESPKPWLSRRVVDHDAEATQATLRLLHAIQQANPGLLIIPAHDADVHDRLGYYPAWFE